MSIRRIQQADCFVLGKSRLDKTQLSVPGLVEINSRCRLGSMVCRVSLEQYLITYPWDHYAQHRRIEFGNGKFHCFHAYSDNQASIGAFSGLGGSSLGFHDSHIDLACGKRLAECG